MSLTTYCSDRQEESPDRAFNRCVEITPKRERMSPISETSSVKRMGGSVLCEVESSALAK